MGVHLRELNPVLKQGIQSLGLHEIPFEMKPVQFFFAVDIALSIGCTSPVRIGLAAC